MSDTHPVDPEHLADPVAESSPLDALPAGAQVLSASMPIARQDEQFIELQFVGGRFDVHAVPVSVLVEFGAVQQLVEGVARRLFFQEHPDRSRVPRGFPEGAKLYLGSSKRNCYTAQIVRPAERQSGTDAAVIHALFERARDTSIEALASVAAGQGLPSGFPLGAVDLLQSLGKRLDDDEVLTIAGRSNGSPAPRARINQQSRGLLAQLVRRPLERVETLVGEIEDIGDNPERFRLRTKDKKLVEIPFTSVQREKLSRAYAMRPMAQVQVTGTLVLGQQLKMKEIDEIEVVDAERFMEVQHVWDRLDKFAALADGWAGRGAGRAPTDTARARAKMVLARLLNDFDNVARPGVYPAPDGGIQAEWIFRAWAVDIVFDPDTGEIDAEATHTETDECREAHFSVQEVTPNDASKLEAWLRDMIA